MLALGRAIQTRIPFLFLIDCAPLLSQTVSDHAPELIESYSSTTDEGMPPASGRPSVQGVSFPVSGGFYDSPSRGGGEAARPIAGSASLAGSRPPTELFRLSQDMEREMELLRSEIEDARQDADSEAMRPAGSASRRAGSATPGDFHGDSAYARQDVDRDAKLPAAFESHEDRGGVQSLTASLPHDLSAPPTSLDVEGEDKTLSHVRFPSSEGHMKGATGRTAPHIQDQSSLHDAAIQKWELEDVDDERSRLHRCSPEPFGTHLELLCCQFCAAR